MRNGLEARHRIQHRFGTTRGASRGARRAEPASNGVQVFDVFVVAGVLAVFGVVVAIAKGVERL